jgi:hypothetical protein
VPLLPAEALGLDHRDALQSDLLQRLLHLIELERLDDGFDLLHVGVTSRNKSFHGRCHGSSTLCAKYPQLNKLLAFSSSKITGGLIGWRNSRQKNAQILSNG